MVARPVVVEVSALPWGQDPDPWLSELGPVGPPGRPIPFPPDVAEAVDTRRATPTRRRRLGSVTSTQM